MTKPKYEIGQELPDIPESVFNAQVYLEKKITGRFQDDNGEWHYEFISFLTMPEWMIEAEVE